MYKITQDNFSEISCFYTLVAKSFFLKMIAISLKILSLTALQVGDTQPRI